MPLLGHASFNRPPLTVALWRYTDLAKFVDLVTSQSLWLTNAEILATDDPYEGLPDAVQFPHRVWKCIDDVPEKLRKQILGLQKMKPDKTPEEIFKNWFMVEEQSCMLSQYWRRQFYVNCWHAADHESAAMWKIYGTPGPGLAIVTNGGRLEEALSSNSEDMYLGAVNYWKSGTIQIGTRNSFDAIMVKRENYSYENEVRLVHRNSEDMHDPLANFAWNDENMRFDDIIQYKRPVNPGLLFQVDIDVLIEKVVISPFSPAWFLPMLERLKEKLNFNFPISNSNLLDPPLIIS